MPIASTPFPRSERGMAAAATAFGYRTASVLASTVLVLIAAHTSWHLAFLVIAVIMAATMLSTFWAPEPQTPGQPPKTLADAVWHPLRNLISQKGAWGFLLLVLLYKAGDAFALSLYSAFMIKGVGFSLDELSIAGKANMTISTITGVTLGGWIYMRWGMFRSLLVFGIGQALTNLLYTVLALAGKKLWLMALATTLDTGVGGMGLAAFVGFLMSLCNANFSATQYALLSALATIPRVTTGAIAGTLVTAIGWPKFFVVTCLTAVPGLILLVILRAPVAGTRGARQRRCEASGAEASVATQWRRLAASRSAAHRPVVRTGPRRSGVVLELAAQVFGLDIDGARPVFRRIRGLDQIVPQMFVPRIEIHFSNSAVEILNLDGLILSIDGHHFKELVGTASIPFAYDRPDNIHRRLRLLCSAAIQLPMSPSRNM